MAGVTTPCARPACVGARLPRRWRCAALLLLLLASSAVCDQSGDDGDDDGLDADGGDDVPSGGAPAAPIAPAPPALVIFKRTLPNASSPVAGDVLTVVLTLTNVGGRRERARAQWLAVPWLRGSCGWPDARGQAAAARLGRAPKRPQPPRSGADPCPPPPLSPPRAPFSAAVDVQLEDAPWSGPVEVVGGGKGGGAKRFWSELPAGASVEHSYKLKAKAPGAFKGPPATATYRVPGRGPGGAASALDWVARSTPAEPRAVVSRAAWAAGLLLGVGSVLSLGFLRTATAWTNFFWLGGSLGTFLGGNHAVLMYKRAAKLRRQRAAEAALMRDE